MRGYEALSTGEDETVAALTLLFVKVAELEQMSVRDLLLAGKYEQYKATLDAAYDALVSVEKALDDIGLKLEYHHWRISSALEELKPLLLRPQSKADLVVETVEQQVKDRFSHG